MDLVSHLSGRLLFGVPKKGRLQQAALDLLSGSDIQFRRQNRLDISLVTNHDIALVFLPADEIPAYVAEGRVDLGITGRDVVLEYTSSQEAVDAHQVHEILDLGFGRCRLMVQVPENGPYQTPQDLIGKNVVTSFDGLTEQYFAKLEGLQINEEELRLDSYALKRKLKTRIKYASGSVEAACPLGRADGIVDLVESGETMQAAGLKAIDTVLASTAVLIRSNKVSANEELINRITSRITGIINAQRYVLCQYNIHRSRLGDGSKITPGKRAPSVTALEEPDWVAVSSMVLKKDIANVMDALQAIGATDILVLGIANSRADAAA